MKDDEYLLKLAREGIRGYQAPSKALISPFAGDGTHLQWDGKNKAIFSFPVEDKFFPRIIPPEPPPEPEPEPTPVPPDPIPPADCCLYPYFEDPEPGFPFTDLIDQVDLTINGATTNLDKYQDGFGLFCFSPTGADPAWIRQDIGQAAWIVTEDATGSSAIYDNQCLISADWNPTNGGTDAVETADLLADTYLVVWAGDSCTVTRTSLCCWAGTSDAFGAEVNMCYNGLDGSTALYKWLLDITWPSGVPGYPGTPGTGGSIKDDPQNSPDGSYPNLGGWDFKPAESGVTVS